MPATSRPSRPATRSRSAPPSSAMRPSKAGSPATPMSPRSTARPAAYRGWSPTRAPACRARARSPARRSLPTTFNLETVERGFGTHVSMAMQGGRITNLVAVPSLAAAADRVPVTSSHKTGIVDPLGAFIIPVDRPGIPSGRAACDRTIKVFDGWTRFDVQLFYKQTKAVDGGDDTYAGRIIVCGARYIPVAGHRLQADSLNDLVDNDRLEVWLVPVEKTSPARAVPHRHRHELGRSGCLCDAIHHRLRPKSVPKRTDGCALFPAIHRPPSPYFCHNLATIASCEMSAGRPSSGCNRLPPSLQMWGRHHGIARRCRRERSGKRSESAIRAGFVPDSFYV